MTKTVSINCQQNLTWFEKINSQKYPYLIKDGTTKIIFNFSTANFIFPVHIVTLGCFIEEYHSRGIEIEIIGNDYLDKIRFNEYWSEGFNRDNFTNTRISTALCLWHISQEMLNDYTFRCAKYYQDLFLAEKDLGPLQTALMEILNNIYDHSRSSNGGYAFTQYYPKKKLIRLAVCDFGVGIPTTVNDFLKRNKESPLNDGEAIKKALELRFSANSKDHNQGRGLNTLNGIVKQNNGSLFILSNNGLLNTYGNKILNFSFGGTLLNTVLDTRYLPEDQEEITEEFSF